MPGKRGLVSQEVAKRNLDGLDMLREANKHYEEGLAIFREGAIKQLQTLEKKVLLKICLLLLKQLFNLKTRIIK